MTGEQEPPYPPPEPLAPGGLATAPPPPRMPQPSSARLRWPSVRRVILVAEAISAVLFAAGAIKYERGAYVAAAWAFGALPLVYAVVGAVRARDQRPIRLAALIVLLPSLVFSTLAVSHACSNRLTPGSNLSGCDFSGVSLAGTDLHGADLSGARLAGADLSRANLRGAKLNHADLSGARLSDSFLDGANLTGANLRRVVLSGVALRNVNLTRTDLRGLNLAGRDLTHLVLAGADLRQTRLGGADLSFANLEGANLAGAALAGSKLDQAKVSRGILEGADLTGATLEGASLDGARLRGAKLSDANLSGASLSGANVVTADLSNADLSKAHLDGVVLTDAILDHARLVGATGLSDAELAQGLAVGEASLAEALTSRDIRLEERAAILRTLGAACRGRGVAEASPYQGTGLHPLMLAGGRGGTTPLGQRANDLGWEPMAVRFGQLVACVEDERSITLEVCPYFDATTGLPGPPTRRVRFERRVRLVEANTSVPLFDQTYSGTSPGPCPLTKTSFGSLGEDVLEGSHIGFQRFKAKLAGYVE